MKKVVRCSNESKLPDGRLVGIIIEDDEVANSLLKYYKDNVDNLYVNWTKYDNLNNAQIMHNNLMNEMLKDDLTVEQFHLLDTFTKVRVIMVNNIIVQFENMDKLSDHQLDKIEDHLGVEGYSDGVMKETYNVDKGA